LKKLEEPEGWNLVGVYHVTRGSITILAGSPGIGKSFATLDLAIKGAIGSGNWLGYTINKRFKTLIIQAENSLLRMIMDAKRVQMPDDLNDHVKLLEFSWGDISLGNSKLVDALRKLMAEFEPDLVIFDPWNQFADDDKAKETKAAMDGIKHILDAAKNPPACLIVAHHRKKREGDAHKGRQMADLISGSYVMQSNPRCVLCYVAYDPTDENDNRVVVLCPKKNNGKNKGPATAWTLCEHGFEAIPDFDYKAWQDGSGEGRSRRPRFAWSTCRPSLRTVR
jgi:RecA-family ATPase